jgi:hypothetical protein
MKVPIFLIALALLFACENELKEGTVVGKFIEPAHTYTYLMPIPHTLTTGKTTTTYFTYIPMIMYDDEDYTLSVKGFTDDGEQKTEIFYVSKSYYDCVSSGTHFVANKNCSRSPNEDIAK